MTDLRVPCHELWVGGRSLDPTDIVLPLSECPPVTAPPTFSCLPPARDKPFLERRAVSKKTMDRLPIAHPVAQGLPTAFIDNNAPPHAVVQMSSTAAAPPAALTPPYVYATRTSPGPPPPAPLAARAPVPAVAAAFPSFPPPPQARAPVPDAQAAIFNRLLNDAKLQCEPPVECYRTLPRLSSYLLPPSPLPHSFVPSLFPSSLRPCLPRDHRRHDVRHHLLRPPHVPVLPGAAAIGQQRPHTLPALQGQRDLSGTQMQCSAV